MLSLSFIAVPLTSRFRYMREAQHTDRQQRFRPFNSARCSVFCSGCSALLVFEAARALLSSLFCTLLGSLISFTSQLLVRTNSSASHSQLPCFSSATVLLTSSAFESVWPSGRQSRWCWKPSCSGQQKIHTRTLPSPRHTSTRTACPFTLHMHTLTLPSTRAASVRCLSIDNSEWSRNGDYAPSRFDAQKETINFLASSKINSNPETTVGLLSLAGDRIEVHISPTRSPGAIMTALAKDVHIGGESKFVAGLKTAALALKNRQNKNQRQRIILFAGSPLPADDGKELLRLSKAFKKNNVSVDIINFGTENTTNENAERWEAFVAGVGGGDANHLVNVPPGPHILSDMVMSSAIMAEEGGGGRGSATSGASGGGGGGGGMAGFGDIDPNQDPEMALAIRMSMEEERARQQRLAGDTPAAATATGEAGTAAATTAATAASSDAVPMEDDEEALLQQAIALSMQMNLSGEEAASVSPAAPTTTTTSATDAAVTAAPTVGSDAALTQAQSEADIDIDAAMQDPDFINSLLASVTGGTGAADTDAMLDQLTGEKKEEKKDEGEDNK